MNETAVAQTEEDQKTFPLMILIPSILSLAGVILIYWVYNSLFRSENTTVKLPRALYRLVVYMATADLVLTLAGLYISREVRGRYCDPFWVTIRECSFLSSIAWTAIFAYSLKHMILNNTTTLDENTEQHGFLLAFLLPIMLVGVPASLGLQDGLNVTCYLEQDNKMASRLTSLFVFLIPVCGVFIFTVYCYAKVLKFLWPKMAWERDFVKVVGELSLFLIGILLCYIFPVVDSLCVMFFNKRYNILKTLHVITQQSTGFINALIYGLKYAPCNYLKNKMKSIRQVFRSSVSSSTKDEDDAILYVELQERMIINRASLANRTSFFNRGSVT